MKQYYVKFSVIASITFFVMMIICILLDHRSDTPWWYYLLTSLVVAIPIAAIGAALDGITPKTPPDPHAPSKSQATNTARVTTDPFAPLVHAAMLPGGRWIYISLWLGVGMGICIALFNGWLATIWEHKASFSKWGRLLIVYAVIGSGVFAVGCGLVGVTCSRLRKVPFFAVTLSSVVMFAVTLGVSIGGTYATASVVKSSKDSDDQVRQQEKFIKNKPSFLGGSNPTDKK